MLFVLRGVGGVAVGVQLVLLAVAMMGLKPADQPDDGLQVWAQAERIRTGGPLYSAMPVGYGPDVMTGGREYPAMANSPYLPPLASLVVLLPRTDVRTFSLLHHSITLVLFWTYAVILARLASGGWSVRSGLAAHGVLFLFPHATPMLINNNIEPLLWCLFGAAFLVPRLRGAVLMLTAAVKVHAAWPLAFLTMRDARRTLASAGPAGVVISGVVILAMGPCDTITAVLDWLRHIPPALGQGSFQSNNVSLSFLPIRAAVWMGWEYSGGPLPPLARVWLLAASLGAPFLAGAFTMRKSTEMQMTVVFAAALLASPLCWLGYLTALLAPAAWTLGTRHGAEQPGSLTTTSWRA